MGTPREARSTSPLIMAALIFLLAALQPALAQEQGGTNATDGGGEQGPGGTHVEEEGEPYYAIIFPWFCEALGIVVFFLITRYFSIIPYTAWMFLMGTFMGVGAVRLGFNDHLTESILMWERINGEVLLLVFLPGLIFKDASSLNVRLFFVSFWQCALLAFPGVLAGAALTALVAYYVFPYGWSFNLAMTFGSIMSATDPVAVNALLNEVGAPPRLKMLISGESLLNDGSAMVFYNIFSTMFLAELGVPGLGGTVSVGEGFALFFRMSLGAMCLGVAFGLALVLCLYLLNRRLNEEENVLQVAATITMAYVTYYVSDPVCGTSGVIAVLFCGVTTKAVGQSMINDHHLLENFWILVEHLLNTLLFALGGVVWGAIIANPVQWSGTDWGYLFLLYVLLIAIRFVIIFGCYPVNKRIGLKSNWREAVFMSWGGLRGAVGIALALSLDATVYENTSNATYQGFSNDLFGMVGGVALLTLIVNGSTSGTMLKSLGLTKSTAVRKRILRRYGRKFRKNMLDDFIFLLADPRFYKVDFALVRDHVPFLKDLTLHEFRVALIRNKEEVPTSRYKIPHVEHVLPYLLQGRDAEKDDVSFMTEFCEQFEEQPTTPVVPTSTGKDYRNSVFTSSEILDKGFKSEVQELRLVFIELLHYEYEEQVMKGELDVRQGGGYVPFVLDQGLQFTAASVSRGKPLCDWDASHIVMVDPGFGRRVYTKASRCFTCNKSSSKEGLTSEYELLVIDVQRAMAFIKAHQGAEERFHEEFADSSGRLTRAEELVMKESQAELEKAKDLLLQNDCKDVETIISHLLCTILLNKSARYVEKLAAMGLLKQQEAESCLEEIEHSLLSISGCYATRHAGELTMQSKRQTVAFVMGSTINMDVSGANLKESSTSSTAFDYAMGSSVTGGLGSATDAGGSTSSAGKDN